MYLAPALLASHNAWLLPATVRFVVCLVRMIVPESLPPDEVQDSAQPVGEPLWGNPVPPALARETCRAGASCTAAPGLHRLPVVESGQSRKLLGVAGRIDLLTPAQRLHGQASRRGRFLHRQLPSCHIRLAIR